MCTFWPSPPDCGLPGKKCCLDPYHKCEIEWVHIVGSLVWGLLQLHSAAP